MTCVSELAVGEALDWRRDGPIGCEQRTAPKSVVHACRREKRALGGMGGASNLEAGPPAQRLKIPGGLGQMILVMAELWAKVVGTSLLA